MIGINRTDLPKFDNLRALVLGDLMLDEYIIGKQYRLSDEVPVPILKVDSFEIRLGGAANVALTLRKLGCHVDLCGFIGTGYSGTRFLNLLNKENINDQFIISADGVITTTKTRILINDCPVARYDYEELVSNNSLCSKMSSIVSSSENKWDFIIVSDYNKGVVTQNIMDVIKKLGTKIFVDPKPQHKWLYTDVFCMTPNKSEFESMFGNLTEKRANDCIDELNLNYLVVTCGREGCNLYSPGISEFVPSYKHEVSNEVGAGDTFIATFAASMAAGKNATISTYLANAAAGIAVTKKFTNCCDYAELEVFIGKL